MKNRKEHNPLVSVIVPVHNVEPFVSRCVESLLQQTIADNIEIVLVENGSVDGSLALCQQFSENHRNVHVLVSEKCGPSEARNLGIHYAHGKYVGFVDGDDYVDPHMFEGLVDAITTTNALTSFCDFEMVYANGERKTNSKRSKCVTVCSGNESAYSILMGETTSSPCVRLFEASFLADKSFPEGQFYEDHAIIYKWIAECETVAHLEFPYYYYCLRAGSTTQSGCNFNHKKDLLSAELGRIKFVQQSKWFSHAQKQKLYRRIMHDAIFVLKSYVYYYGGDEKEYGHVMELREKLLNGVPVTMAQVGFGTWLRLKRIRYSWNRYYKHLVKKSR